MTKGHGYKLVYEIKWTSHPGGLERDQIPDGNGATDALLLVSCIYPEDGSYSQEWYSCDGRTDESMSDADVFKIWSLMAKNLADSKTLSEGKRSFAEFVFERFREIILMSRADDEGRH